MMSLKELFDISDDLEILENDDMIKITFGDLKTGWISRSDSFLKRIGPENLNEFFPLKHLRKEMEIKNVLDDGIDFLNHEKYARAIACFDKVICYDDAYPEALFNKSRALYGQGHFVKALRFFRKSNVEDNDYYRLLLKKSSEERDSFPKIKRNIYAGDEAASKGELQKAVEFYDKALLNPSKFKDKILFKLLNKKAFALIRLGRFDEASASFEVSLGVHENDAAFFGLGYCRHKLGLDCADSLKKAVSINKKYLLVKAEIFEELECHDEALKCFDEFLASHFSVDDDFTRALKGKADALDALDMDSSHEKEILSRIMNKSY